VILDMIMPRMGGAELMRRLTAMEPDLKVLLCSGHKFSEQALAGLNHDQRGFIKKPFTLQILSSKIRQLLDV